MTQFDALPDAEAERRLVCAQDKATYTDQEFHGLVNAWEMGLVEIDVAGNVTWLDPTQIDFILSIRQDLDQMEQQ